MNRVKVVICGKEYFLKTENDTTYIYNLARALDKRINMVMDNANVSAQSASVMVALSLLDDLKTADKELNIANQNVDIMQDKISYIDAITKQRDDALKEVERLNVKVKGLENSLKLKDLGKVTSESTSKSKESKG